MSQWTSTNLTIGILGAYRLCSQKKQLTRHLALQGAFVEHQVALQELPIQKKIDVVLVRSPEDLIKCQALIIPGGGMFLIYVSLNPSWQIRIYHDCTSRTIIWAIGTFAEFCESETCLGNMCGSDPYGKSCEKCKERRAGAFRWNVHHNRTEWLGIPSEYRYSILAFRISHYRCVLRPSRSRLTSKSPDSENLNVHSRVSLFERLFVSLPGWLCLILNFEQVVLTLEPSPEDPPIQIISCLSPHLLPESLISSNSTNEPRTFVALRQGHHFLTTFHPELTQDNRFHEYFVTECVLPSINIPRP